MSLQKFTDECRKIAGSRAGLLEKPPKQLADLALPCFSLGEKPVEIAANLAAELKKRITKGSLIKDISALGPYVNFYIDGDKFARIVLVDILKKKRYGSGARKKEKIILEHTSMNPSGPVHIGRVRNSIIGDALRRILMFDGYPVETYYFVNDIGKQIAMIVWAEKNKISPKSELIEQYKEYRKKHDFQTMFLYVSANELLKKEPLRMEEVEKILEKSEKGDKKEIARLKKVAKYCLAGQVETIKRIGIIFDKFVFESRFIENGAAKKVLAVLKRRKLLKNVDGALALDLSSHGLRDTVVLQRSNDTSVYLLRDLAYHVEKLSEAGCAINVLGEDHKIEFSELRAILQSILKIKKPLEAVHYSFVNFQGLRLSTREGQIAPLDALLDEGIRKALDEMKKRRKTQNASIAEHIAVAAVKYHIIRTDTMKAINFLWDEALSFEGDTGPYLQYTLARANSILRKSRKKPSVGRLNNEKEINLVKKLAEFPIIVGRCSKELKPHQLANYLHGLAADFNEYYHSIRVIGSAEEQKRLVLVKAFATVLKNGMNLIGIEPLERM